LNVAQEKLTDSIIKKWFLAGIFTQDAKKCWQKAIAQSKNTSSE
jgi:hypothetical protein